MSKKVLTFIVILTLLFVQCFSQNEYMTKEYSFSSEDELVSITFTDSTKQYYNDAKYLVAVREDSLLLVHKEVTFNARNDSNTYILPYTLKLNSISSIEVIENDGTSTLSLIVLGGSALFIG